MLVNAQVLRQKIQQYFSGEIEKEDLGLWAMEAYYNLMKGEYIEIDKLIVYHFLREISTFHLTPNDVTEEYPCTDKDVLEIKKILYGEKNINYTFNIKIYKNLYLKEIYKGRMEQFKKLREGIEKINDMNEIPLLVVNKLFEYVQMKFNDGNSLIDLLAEHIKCIIVEHIDFGDEILDFRQSVGIYVGRSDINKNKESIIPNLKKLLDCVMGEICFRISVVYKEGIPSLSLVLL